MFLGKKQSWALLALATVLISFLPVSFTHKQNLPKKDAEYIRRVFGDQTVGQTFATNYQMQGMEIMVRAEKEVAADVEVVNAQGQQIAELHIQAGPSDAWKEVVFTEPLPAGEHAITFRAPAVTQQSDAILVRYQPDSGIYDQGHMVVNGEESYGDIAFRTHNRSPLWKVLILKLQITDASALYGLRLTLIGAAVAVAVGVLVQRIPKQKRVIISLAVLFVATLAIRAPYVRSIEGVFGGDAFNYYSKAYALTQGMDPFASDPRKAPLYSFLLLPGIYMTDPLFWSRWVGIVAAGAAACFTALAGRRLGLPWHMALAAGFLLAINPEFIWESPSGLANTTFTAFVVAAVWAYTEYFHTKKQVWLWYVGVFGALATLTRYEGALIAGVLLVSALGFARVGVKKSLAILALSAAIMAIPLSSYIWSGELGVRTVSDIQEDEGLFLVRSDEDLEKNISRMHGFFAGAWVRFEQLVGILTPFLIGIVAAAAGLVTKKYIPRIPTGAYYVPAVLILGALYLFIAAKDPLGRHTFIALTFIALGAGTAVLAWKKPKVTLPIIVAMALHVVFILFILPKSRYFLPTLPFFAIALAAAVSYAVPTRRTLHMLISMALVGVFGSYVWVDGTLSLADREEHYNADAHEETVMLKALQFLRESHGRVGYFASSASNPFFIYIPADRRYGFAEESLEQEIAWLKKDKIRYLIERPSGRLWMGPQEYPEAFQVSHIFDSIYGDSTVTVYKVFPDELPE